MVPGRRPDGGGARQGDDTVIATAGTDEKVDLAKSYGADYGINYRTKISVRKSSNTRVGPTSSTTRRRRRVQGVASLYQFRGRIIIIGFASGEVPQITTNYPLVVFYR